MFVRVLVSLSHIYREREGEREKKKKKKKGNMMMSDKTSYCIPTQGRLYNTMGARARQ